MKEFMEMLPDGSVVPIWVLALAGALRFLSVDKIFYSAWEDILKPHYVNKTKTAYKATDQVVSNTLTLPNAMDSIGYHYYSIGRRLVDIAMSMPDYVVTWEGRINFFRSRISTDMQRSRNLLATKVSDTGARLDAHLNEFQGNENNVVEFYTPVVEAFERGATVLELREVILIQVDKLYSDASIFFQTKSKKDGILQRDFELLTQFSHSKGHELS